MTWGESDAYRAFLEAQALRPPASLSISLSILVSTDAQTVRDQYDIDLHTGEVADVLGRGNEARVALCDFAALGGPRSPLALDALAQQHPSKRVRAACGGTPSAERTRGEWRAVRSEWSRLVVAPLAPLSLITIFNLLAKHSEEWRAVGSE